MHVTTAHDPRDIRIFRKQCASLGKVFGDVHLVAPWHADFEEENVYVHGVKRHDGRLGRVMRTLPRVFAEARRLGADLYHLHDPDLLLVANRLRQGGARVIFDSHEDYPRDLYSRPYLRSRTGRLIVRGYSAFENRVLKRIDGVVTVNRAMTERIRNIQPNTLTIYNFPIADSLPAPRKAPSFPDRMIWLGLINAARGVRNLDAAARMLEAGSIDVIGRCDDIDLSSSALNYLGKMDYPEALSRTAEYAGGLATFPTNDFHKDMFPIKLFEYMLMGLPVIASRFPKWEKLMGQSGCAILVDPDNPADIAEAANWVLRNPEQARIMGAKGRVLALREFAWQSEERKLIGFYGMLLGSSSLGARASEYLPFHPAGSEALL